MSNPNTKRKAIKTFISKLLATPIRDEISKIFLFGSVLRGDFRKMLIYGIRNKFSKIVRKLSPYIFPNEEYVIWERRFKQIASLVGEWIWEIDSKGYFTYCNPVVEQVLGYNAEEMRGRLLYDLFYHEDLTKFRDLLVDVFSKGRPFKDFTARFIHKEGHLLTIESHGLPILSHDGVLLGYVGVSRDISERIKLTKRVAESQKMAALGQLSAGIAHEIRNPLQVMSGYTRLLSMTEESKERKEKIKIIEEHIDRIERILQGISQYVRKTPPKEREKVNLNTIIQEVISLILYFDTFLPTSKSEPRKNGQNRRKSANPKQQCSAT